MDLFKKNSDEKLIPKGEGNDKKGAKIPTGKNFWVNLLTTLVIFFLLISTYSLIAEQRAKTDRIPLSHLAVDIEAGIVESVEVKGDDLVILYKDETEKKSKKETGTAITDTRKDHDVTTEALSSVSIAIPNSCGSRSWRC